MSRRIRMAGVIAAVAAGSLGLAVADELEEAEVERRLRTGRSKSMVEGPVKRALDRKFELGSIDLNARIRTGASKIRVERPVLAALETALPAPSAAKNQRVPAGLVRWHASFEQARAASAKSGKPVMLFQLLGRLDESFC